MIRYIFRNSTVKVYIYINDELNEPEKIQIIKEYNENPLGGHQGLRGHQNL